MQPVSRSSARRDVSRKLILVALGLSPSRPSSRRGDGPAPRLLSKRRARRCERGTAEMPAQTTACACSSRRASGCARTPSRRASADELVRPGRLVRAAGGVAAAALAWGLFEAQWVQCRRLPSGFPDCRRSSPACASSISPIRTSARCRSTPARSSGPSPSVDAAGRTWSPSPAISWRGSAERRRCAARSAP